MNQADAIRQKLREIDAICVYSPNKGLSAH